MHDLFVQDFKLKLEFMTLPLRAGLGAWLAFQLYWLEDHPYRPKVL